MDPRQDTNTPYLPIVQPALGPPWIDHVLRCRGIPTPRIRHQCDSPMRSFSYLDIGCGFGLSLLYLAAAYPEASFEGIDLNPEHIAWAQSIATEAEISNVEFKMADICSLELDDFTPANYIVCDGVFSWVSSDVRAHLIRAIDVLLLSGGAAVVSANQVQGWVEMQSAQRLLVDLQAASPDADPDDIVIRGRTLVAETAKAGRSSPFRRGAECFEDIMSRFRTNYIVHEFLRPDWQPIWTTDLARAFSAIGCHYVADANLNLLRDKYALMKNQRELVATAENRDLELTLRDIFQSRFLIRAIFWRASEPSTRIDATSRLSGWLALVGDPEAVRYDHMSHAGKVTFDSPATRHIVSRLADGPRNLQDIADELDGLDDDAFMDYVDCLCGSGQAVPVDPPASGEAVDRLNETVRRHGVPVRFAADVHGTPKQI